MATRRRKKKPNSGGALGYCVAVVAHGEEHPFGGLGMCGAPVTTLRLGERGEEGPVKIGHGCAKGHVGSPYASREELDREVAARRVNVENMKAEVMAAGDEDPDSAVDMISFLGLPLIPDAWCSECAKLGNVERQRMSPSGVTCKYGHGDAPSLSHSPATHSGEAREATHADVIDPGFEVREGDRLTVLYNGAKLQIAKFNTVELDGGIYSRTLLPGDDPEEQWDRIHRYLERKALERARAKLASFADEIKTARERAGT